VVTNGQSDNFRSGQNFGEPHEALKPEHDAEDTSRGWWNLTPEERKQKMGAGLAAYHTKRRADREAEREEAVAQ
jgi:hypothetical protein